MFRKWKKSLAVMTALALAVVLDIAVAPIVAEGKEPQWCTDADHIDVDFSATPTAGEAPLRVQFTDKTAVTTFDCLGAFPPLQLYPDYTRLWEFGDGNTSTDANPVNTYGRPGRYTVTLTLFFEATICSVLPLDALLPGGTAGNSLEGYEVSETKELYITVWEREEILERPEPAKMVVAYLDISPQEVVQGQELEISVNVCNRGEEKGSHSVALMINGHAEQSQTVVVSPGSCQTVLFRTFKTVPGSYEVWVEGATGSFSVMPLFPGYVVREAPPPESRGIGTAGIVTIVIVVIVLAVGLVLILRR